MAEKGKLRLPRFFCAFPLTQEDLTCDKLHCFRVSPTAMKVKDVIRKGRGVRRGPGLDEVDAEILVGSSACQNVVGSACRDREVREGGKYWKVGEGDTEMQSREDAEKHFTLKLG